MLQDVMPTGCASDAQRILSMLDQVLETKTGLSEKTFASRHLCDRDFRERISNGRMSPWKMRNAEKFLTDMLNAGP